MRSLVAGTLFSALLLLTAGSASATGVPYENWTETWIFPEEGPNGLEWNVGGFYSGSEQWELFDLVPSAESSEVYEQDSFLGWQVSITIPNFVDPLPKKILKVLFEGNGDLGSENIFAPSVLSIVATDTLYGGGPTTVIECPESDDCHLSWQDSQVTPGDPDLLQVWEIWHLYPNPDWEVVTVFIPAEFDPISFHVITQSVGDVVPEPSSLVLVSLGLLGLARFGRPRHAA